MKRIYIGVLLLSLLCVVLSVNAAAPSWLLSISDVKNQMVELPDGRTTARLDGTQLKLKPGKYKLFYVLSGDVASRVILFKWVGAQNAQPDQDLCWKTQKLFAHKSGLPTKGTKTFLVTKKDAWMFGYQYYAVGPKKYILANNPSDPEMDGTTTLTVNSNASPIQLSFDFAPKDGSGDKPQSAKILIKKVG